MKVKAFLALGIVIIAASSCRRPSAGNGTYLAVTSTWIEAAARDVSGRQMPIYRLAPPTQDPRRLRLKKDHIGPLGGCGQLIRFDFQNEIDARLSEAMPRGPLITQIHPQASLCIPSTYEDCCRQVAEHLCATGRLDRQTANNRLREIHARLQALAAEVLKSISDAGLADAPVVCSKDQETFVRWLGMDVAAVFDTFGDRPADEFMKALQEGGPRLIVVESCGAASIRDEINSARLPIAFINSQPAMTPQQRDFDSLLRANVAAIIEAAAPRQGEKKQ